MSNVSEKFQVSPYFVFFLVHSMQYGVGILGFQRLIAKHARHDAWISVLIAGLVTHLIIWIIYRLLENSNGNIQSIHNHIAGVRVGSVFTFLLSVYFIAQTIDVLRTYIEVIQVWMFPTMNTTVFSFLLLSLVLYAVLGGFRVVTGICFLGVILPSFLLLTFLVTLEFGVFGRFLPIINVSFKDILLGARQMSLSVIGFEALLVYYPFIKHAKKSQPWAHAALLFTTCIYLIWMASAIIFFSSAQLEKNIWATLSIWKIIELPFIERFEYIGIATWCLVILTNLCLGVWCASRLWRELFRIKQEHASYIVIAVVFLVLQSLNTREIVNQFNDILSIAGFYFLIAYIPSLYFLQFMAIKWRGALK